MTDVEKADLKTFMAPSRRRVAEVAKCSVAQACATLILLVICTYPRKDCRTKG